MQITPNQNSSSGKFDSWPHLGRHGWGPHLLLIFILAAATALIYSNSLKSPFILDDIGNITENRHIRVTELSVGAFINLIQECPVRPVPMATFALNYYFGGYDTFGYHLVNIIVHALNGILLYILVFITLNISRKQSSGVLRPPEVPAAFIAFAAALLWTVHPVNTQSVTYIVQRMNSMTAMCSLMALLGYIAARITLRPKKGALWMAAAISTWLLALGSKETAAVLPFVVLLYEWYFFRDLSPDWLKDKWKYFALVALIFVVLAFVFLGPAPLEKLSALRDFSEARFTLGERVLTQSRVVVHYLSLFFYPHPSRLNLDYDFPISHSLFDPLTTLLSVLFLSALLGVGLATARNHRLLSFCIFWYFLNLAIESSVIPLAIIFEHRTYLPFMGLALTLILIIEKALRPNLLRAAVLLVAVGICAVWTHERNQVWQNRLTLWQDAVAKSPGKARPHNNLGLAQLDLGRFDEAIAQFKSVLAIEPEHIEALNSLGLALQHKNLTIRAIHYFKTALVHAPLDAMTLNNLGAAYMKLNEIDPAIEQFEHALRIDAAMSPAHTNLGIALIQKGDFIAGVKHLEKGVVLDPENENARTNLNHAKILKKQIEDQIVELQAAARQEPVNIQHHIDLSRLHKSIGNHTLAIDALNRALNIEPGSDILLNDLGNLYLSLKHYSEAQEVFMTHLKQAPDFSLPYFNLARWHAKQGLQSEALVWLAKAIGRGYTNWEQIESDPDLEAIRESKEYSKLIEARGRK